MVIYCAGGVRAGSSVFIRNWRAGVPRYSVVRRYAAAGTGKGVTLNAFSNVPAIAAARCLATYGKYGRHRHDGAWRRKGTLRLSASELVTFLLFRVYNSLPRGVSDFQGRHCHSKSWLARLLLGDEDKLLLRSAVIAANAAAGRPRTRRHRHGAAWSESKR